MKTQNINKDRNLEGSKLMDPENPRLKEPDKKNNDLDDTNDFNVLKIVLIKFIHTSIY